MRVLLVEDDPLVADAVCAGMRDSDDYMGTRNHTTETGFGSANVTMATIICAAPIADTYRSPKLYEQLQPFI